MRARRRGGIPPIVTVLITISAVVAAGLVAWFLFSTTSSATKQPMLEVTSAYGAGNTLTITIRNIGTQEVSGLSVTDLVCKSGYSASLSCNTPNLSPGQSAACSGSGSGSIQDGDTCTAVIRTNSGSLAVGFKVVVP
ncbi:MAG: hypothetical protein LM580_10610 [Thermofilum sp.]|nr:hypothetical protein [Thermofilum sp.]